MPVPHPTLRVRILDRDYTLNAAADTHLRLKDAARQLDTAMRAQQMRDPAADTAQLAVLAALELLRTPQTATSLHERDIARGLTALHRKLDHLDAIMSVPVPTSSDSSDGSSTRNSQEKFLTAQSNGPVRGSSQGRHATKI